jgi:hypothetical protein
MKVSIESGRRASPLSANSLGVTPSAIQVFQKRLPIMLKRFLSSELYTSHCLGGNLHGLNGFTPRLFRGFEDLPCLFPENRLCHGLCTCAIDLSHERFSKDKMSFCEFLRPFLGPPFKRHPSREKSILSHLRRSACSRGEEPGKKRMLDQMASYSHDSLGFSLLIRVLDPRS